MEEALKCIICKEFARDAVESTCQCVLLYCDKCSKKAYQCCICQSKLSKKHCNPDNQIFGFAENKLARRLIAQMKINCEVPTCNEQVNLHEVGNHWRRCPQRMYQCSFCQEQIESKSLFKEHVMEQHEEEMLSIFDEQLEGSFIKREFDRIILSLKLDKEEDEEEDDEEQYKPLDDEPQDFEGEEEKEGSDQNQQTGNSREEPISQNSVLSESFMLQRNGSINQNLWQCYMCFTLNQQDYCSSCNQNYIEMKENMKSFIDKMKKDQRKEHLKILKQKFNEQRKMDKKEKGQEECLLF